MWADLSFETSSGQKHYRSPHILFSTVTTNGVAQIPAETMRGLAMSMIELPRIGQVEPENFFASAYSMPGVGFASVAVGPEADMYAFGAANPVPSQANDLYLADSDYRMLTGASYSENIGNG